MMINNYWKNATYDIRIAVESLLEEVTDLKACLRERKEQGELNDNEFQVLIERLEYIDFDASEALKDLNKQFKEIKDYE